MVSTSAIEPLLGSRWSAFARANQRARCDALMVLGGLLLLGAVVFTAGITWGLPSRAVDPFLFGDHPVWTGKQILERAGQWQQGDSLGADVDRDPLLRRDRVVALNATDVQRAEIIRRYRLFTYHPDEMVTMMALKEMSPGQERLDPKLYQYGGLWIYPVGAIIKAAAVAGLLKLTPDPAFYLDHPEEFGRFYVAARLYVVAWALVGVWVVFAIARRLSGGALWPAAVAGLCYVLLPVVVNMSHEAKPHLPGAVLMLLAVRVAMQYVQTAEGRWWWLAVGLCGAAVGMVLIAWPVLVLAVLMPMLIQQPWRRRAKDAASGVALAAGVYFLMNPYVLIHLFDNRELLQSNLGNTRAMFTFSVGPAAWANAAWLIGMGATYAIGLIGAVAAVVLSARAFMTSGFAKQHIVLLLAPMVLLGLQFIVFARGQAAEYARFAVLIDLVLLVLAVVGTVGLLVRLRWASALTLGLVMPVAAAGWPYVRGFVADTRAGTTRQAAAEHMEEWYGEGARTVGMLAEPAPYIMPPVNVFDWQMMLLPRDVAQNPTDGRADVLVTACIAGQRLPDLEAAGYKSDPQPTAAAAPMQWAGLGFTTWSEAKGEP